MTFGESIKVCMAQKYVKFGGTASRSEFWWFQLFIALIYLGVYALTFVCTLLAFTPYIGFLFVITKWVLWLGYFAFMLPSLAVGARRLRDAGYSPWLLFLHLAIGVGSIVLLVFCCMPSKTQEKQPEIAQA